MKCYSQRGGTSCVQWNLSFANWAIHKIIHFWQWMNRDWFEIMRFLFWLRLWDTIEEGGVIFWTWPWTKRKFHE